MSCFIEITNDLSELDHYSKIIKILELSNKERRSGNIYMTKKKLRFLLMAS